MRKRIISIICILAVAFSVNLSTTVSMAQAQEEDKSAGRTFYISSINGNNRNSGTSEDSPWETLDKIGEINLQPGDRILLEAGSIFNGYIHLKNVSGTTENPIVIDKYGTGERPIINCNGQGIWYQDYGKQLDNSGHKYKGYVSSAILLYDTDYIEIRNLEITNQISDPELEWNRLDNKADDRMDRTGVAVIAKNGGTTEHIYIENLYIHNIDGNLEDKHMNNGGIQMNALKPDNETLTGIARFNDIKISGCYVKDVSRPGIVVGYTYYWDKFTTTYLDDEVVKKYGHTNILIENNYVQNSGNDAICVMYSYKPLVQRNVSDGAGADLAAGYSGYWQSFCCTIWPWKCKDAIFQYNEAFDTVGTNNGDGQAWDIDYSDGTIYQYNYSHNNGGGAFLICLTQAVNGVFRYNISQNDLKCLITFQGNPTAYIYNNVFYIDGDRATRINHPDSGKNSGSGVLYNNIFYNVSSANPNDSWTEGSNRIYSNNIYYGYTSVPSNDPNAITEDPKFVNPGSAPTGTLGTVHEISAFEGYKLQPDSPAINNGIYISNNGGRDFFGNPVGLVPDIGVHETGVPDTTVKGIYSDVYEIVGSIIRSVPKNTTVRDFLSNLKYSDGVSCYVINEGQIMDESEIVMDGMLLRAKGPDFVLEYTINLLRTMVEYSPVGMTAQVGSYQQGNPNEGDGNLALDDDLTTMWHTNWNGCARDDCWITIDMGKVQKVSFLKYVPRISGGTNGIITRYEIYLSIDGVNFTKAQTDGDVWAGNSEIKYAYFSEENARYVKLVGLETMSRESGKIFCSAAEIRLGYME